MNSEEFMREIGGRIREAAQRSGQQPMELLGGGFAGTSQDGSVTVWTNAAGQLQSVRIRPGSFMAGDEHTIELALLEATKAATLSAWRLMLPALDVQEPDTDRDAMTVGQSTGPVDTAAGRQPAPGHARRREVEEPDDEDWSGGIMSPVRGR